MKKIAFTMAEILLSLTIIGVVAAITLPSLMGNINERTWNTQRKALHARMSQAIAMMPQLSGYGKYSFTEDEETGDVSVTENTATEAFVTEGLSKVLKINNICDNEHLEDCGIPSSVTGMEGGNVYSTPPRNIGSFTTALYVLDNFVNSLMATAGFETQNGESILVAYNPNCISKQDTPNFSVSDALCANFMYDLNGNKGPNTVGKDIGYMSAFYATEPVVVAPVPLFLETDYGWSFDEVSGACNGYDNARSMSIEELISFAINFNPQTQNSEIFYSNTRYGLNQFYALDKDGAFFQYVYVAGQDEKGSVFCTKR